MRTVRVLPHIKRLDDCGGGVTILLAAL